MSKEKTIEEKLTEHIREKWNHALCLICEANSWHLGELMYLTARELRKLPTIPVICTNCGNTVLINAIVAGIIPPEEIELEKDPQES